MPNICSGCDVIPLVVICTTLLFLSYVFYFIDILAADRSVSSQQWSQSLYNDNTARLDVLVESYYGPPIYEMSANDLTRKWLREAYREEIENYMKQQPGDTARQGQEEEETDYDYLFHHLATDLASHDSLTQRLDYGGDWSDEDVLLGYMIHKQERNALEEQEVSDILQVIFPTFMWNTWLK